MSSSRKRKLFVWARVFTACVTFLLLTMTVMQRADQDGYQATHLFFMPRQSWEMDQGRGMLHEEDYYRDVDAQAFAREIYGWERARNQEGEVGHHDANRDADI